MSFEENIRKLDAVFESSGYPVIGEVVYNRSIDEDGKKCLACYSAGQWLHSDTKYNDFAQTEYAICFDPESAENQLVIDPEQPLYFVDFYNDKIAEFYASNSRGVSMATRFEKTGILFTSKEDAESCLPGVKAAIKQVFVAYKESIVP